MIKYGLNHDMSILMIIKKEKKCSLELILRTTLDTDMEEETKNILSFFDLDYNLMDDYYEIYKDGKYCLKISYFDMDLPKFMSYIEEKFSLKKDVPDSKFKKDECVEKPLIIKLFECGVLKTNIKITDITFLYKEGGEK